MMPCQRGEAPAVLRDGAPKWTAAWLLRRSERPGTVFHWPEVGGEGVNKPITHSLLQMTAGHCAYCDGFPLDELGFPTIDHFRPKSRFPERAFDWDNLLPACHRCQSPHLGKGDQWDERLLKPDAEGYSFGGHFVYRSESGRLEVDPEASAEQRARAEVTIQLLGLNGGSRPQARRRAALECQSRPEADRPYRFVYPPG